MIPAHTDREPRPTQLLTAIGGALTLAVGTMVLVGWARDQSALKSILPGWPSVKPNTALAFLLIGLALLFSSGLPSPGFRRPLAARLCGLLAGLIGLLTLGEYLFGWNPGLDQWLFKEPSGTVGTSHPGRMAPDSALCFVLLAAGLELIRLRRPSMAPLKAVATLGAMVTALALSAMTLYFTNELGAHGWWGLTIMAVPTAWVFLILGVVLMLTTWSAITNRPAAASSARDAARGRTGFAMLLASLLLAVGAVVAGVGYYRGFEKHYRREVEANLISVAELKVGELVQWRKERLADGAMVMKNAPFATLVHRSFEGPQEEDARRELQPWLSAIRKSYEYDRVFVIDNQGIQRIAVPDAPEPSGGRQASAIAQILRSGQSNFLDLHQGSAGPSIHLSVVVPLLEKGATGAPLGALVLRINPANYLFPLIQHWPTPSRTAETLLVRREGDDVLYLNELRHRSGTALTLRRSSLNSPGPASRAVRGELGPFECLDYRGVPVLAVTRAVTDSPWYMVTKIDVDEIYLPLRTEAWRTGGTVALLTATSILAGLASWRQQQARQLGRELELEREHKALAERLALVTRHANDIILLTEESGRIVEANDRAITAYGYTLAELRQLPPGSLIPEATHLRSHLAEALTPDGIVAELAHRRRDGTIFTVEDSSRAVEVEGRRMILSVCRDTSERRKAEVALRASEARYRRLFESAKDGILILEAETGMVVDVNRSLLDTLSCSHAALLHKKVWELNGWRDIICNEAVFADLQRQEYVRFEAKPLETGDGRRILMEFTSTHYLVEGRRVVQCNLRDVTERRREMQTQAALVARQEAILAAVPDIIVEVNLDQIYVWANQAARKFFGDDLIGQAAAAYLVGAPGNGESPPPLFTSDLDVTHVESWQRRRDGLPRLLAWWCRQLRDADGKITGALSTAHDITDHKQAQVKIAEQLDELRRWNDAMEGREGRVIEMKQEVNALLVRLGEPPRYPSQIASDPESPPADA